MAKFQYEVDMLNEFFIDAVVSGRLMDADKVKGLATGHIWIGSEALAAGLVDEIGTLDSVVQALVNEVGQSNSAAHLSQEGDGMSNEGLEARVAEP